VKLDFRKAIFVHPVTTVHFIVVMGGFEAVVPVGVQVQMRTSVHPFGIISRDGVIHGMLAYMPRIFLIISSPTSLEIIGPAATRGRNAPATFIISCSPHVALAHTLAHSSATACAHKVKGTVSDFFNRRAAQRCACACRLV